MAFVPVPNVYQVNLVYQSASGEAQNTLYFERQGFADLEDMSALAEMIVDWWDSGIKMETADSVSLIKVLVKDIGEEDGLGIEYTTGLPIAGTITAGVLPACVSMTVKFLTGLTGRTHRGRNYVFGIRETAVAGDTIEAETAQDYVNAYTNLISFAALQSLTWVVVSRHMGGSPRTSGVTTAITNCGTDGIVASQRRRLTGRGS